jgi:hypothetical protein
MKTKIAARRRRDRADFRLPLIWVNPGKGLFL